MRLLTLNCHSWQEKDQIKKIEQKKQYENIGPVAV